MTVFITAFPVHVIASIELELKSAGFGGGAKTGEFVEKPSDQGENQQQTQAT